MQVKWILNIPINWNINKNYNINNQITKLRAELQKGFT